MIVKVITKKSIPMGDKVYTYEEFMYHGGVSSIKGENKRIYLLFFDGTVLELPFTTLREISNDDVSTDSER